MHVNERVCICVWLCDVVCVAVAGWVFGFMRACMHGSTDAYLCLSLFACFFHSICLHLHIYDPSLPAYLSIQ